jgi:two-component system, LytTR family, response regulator
MTIRALVVDDEAPARRKLVRLLGQAEDVEVAGEAANGAEAVRAIRERRPDVAFLDVRMPGLDGFGVVREVGSDAVPCIVFVTAYDDHAVQAFEVQALDYLLKPVAPSRFQAALERVREALARGRTADLAARLERALASARSPGSPWLERLLVPQDDRQVLIAVDRIDRIDAAGNYVQIHTADGRYLLRTPIGTLAARLDPSRFVRISRSDVVRLDAVRELVPWFHGDQRVVLKDGTTLMWSRRYRGQGPDFAV